jgi:hypothetical protein
LGSAFTYQGRLRDSGGTPIEDTCDFTFGLWDAESGGTQVGTDSLVSGVAVADGYFAVSVNSGGEFGTFAFAGEERWLEIAVQCTGDPTPVTLSPRQLLSAAPYAHYALNVASHNHWGETWTGSGTGLNLSGGSTGLRGSGSSNGLWGVSASSVGRGVFGHSTAITGTTYGVYGQSDSNEGFGVVGVVGATSGATYGVLGQSSSPDGTGVRGYNNATSGQARGVYGQSTSPEGRAVLGWASASSGSTYGVYGQSDSSGGAGVYGTNAAGGWAGFFNGDVTITGAAIGFFPRPAYDSGWQDIAQGQTTTLTHNLGGDPLNYVVDMWCLDDTGWYDINQVGYGFYHNQYGVSQGAAWLRLDNTSINISRNVEDGACKQIRIRIWVYQ